MRPTVGQILSGLALGAVAASMLVMPERFLGADDATVRGLMLQAPAERSVVQAAPIRARRVQVHRSAPIKRSVAVVAQRAPFTVSHLPADPGPAACSTPASAGSQGRGTEAAGRSRTAARAAASSSAGCAC